MTPAQKDRQLSPHFSLYQLTVTNHADLQEENRHVTHEEELKLCALANLLETCRAILGGDLDVHSGRRYLQLNKRVGGSDRSQHLKCEAADISLQGPDSETSVLDSWQDLCTAGREGKLAFGQLIFESASDGREGRKWWIHVSLGAPHRAKERCGEILTFRDGKYTMIAKLP